MIKPAVHETELVVHMHICTYNRIKRNRKRISHDISHSQNRKRGAREINCGLWDMNSVSYDAINVLHD